MGPRATGKTTTASRHSATTIRLDRPAEAEERLREQFTSLDTLLTQLNTTSEYLAQQLQALPGTTSNAA